MSLQLFVKFSTVPTHRRLKTHTQSLSVTATSSGTAWFELFSSPLKAGFV